MSLTFKRIKEAFAYRLARAAGIAPTVELVRQNERMRAETEALRQRADGLQHLLECVKVRPILFTSMPKSGTYFVSSTLAKGLAIDSRIVSNQYFPYDSVRFFELKALADAGGVSQDHFDASPINLTHIARFFDRITVQVRDPRQAMLSWIHFIDRFRETDETYLFIYPPLPGRFFNRPLAERIDWAIVEWLPLLVEWTQGWLDAAESGPLKVQIARFEDMVADGQTYFDALLDFHAIPRERFVMPPTALDEAVHFRKGETDEWRGVFTPTQAAAAKAAIPTALAERMRWADDPA